MARLKGNGGRRVLIEKMSEKSSRQVTFSKRRKGLIKKAIELVTLCAAQIQLVVFFPGGKVYTFGHPSAESIIARFLGEEPEQNDESEELVQAHRNSKQNLCNMELNKLEEKLDAARRVRSAIALMRAQTEGRVWWELPTHTFDKEKIVTCLEYFESFLQIMTAQILLLKENQSQVRQGLGLSDVIPLDATGGSLQVPVSFDPKGKAPTVELPSIQTSSVSCTYPFRFGLNNSELPYNYIPISGGSSNGSLLDPMLVQLFRGLSFNPTGTELRSQPQFDSMTHEFDGSRLELPIIEESTEFNSALKYDPMEDGSSSQQRKVESNFGPMSPGFFAGLTFDHMMPNNESNHP